MSRVFANKSLDLFRDVFVDFLFCLLPSRVDLTVTWTSHRLPTLWGRFEDIVPPLPTYGSAEGDDDFSQGVVDRNEAAEVFDDVSMGLGMFSDTVRVLYLSIQCAGHFGVL